MSQLREVIGNRLHVKNRESRASVEPFLSLDTQGFGAIRAPIQEVGCKQAHDRKSSVQFYYVSFAFVHNMFETYTRGRDDKRAKIIALREV